jgi:hypothetical protein
MVYEYENPTGFFPTASTKILQDSTEYIPFQGPYEDIRIPDLSPGEVVNTCSIVFHNALSRLQLANSNKWCF